MYPYSQSKFLYTLCNYRNKFQYNLTSIHLDMLTSIHLDMCLHK